MFEFVSNQWLRIVLEIILAVFTGLLGFLGGINYNKIKKKNNINKIKNSNINNINQSNR